ncbi:MAG: YncE family protein [Deltaproteobacteria bacterium]|nr:YncE family protein [Deltaproteobacteria bacterium]
MKGRNWLAVLALAACEPETAEPAWQLYHGDAYSEAPADIPWPAGELALTSDSGADTLTALNPLTGQRLAVVQVGRDPVAIDGPHHLAIDRARGYVYVALSYPAAALTPGPHAAHGSSIRPGYVQKLRLNDLRSVAERAIEANPGDIALSADGSTLVISHFDLATASKVGTVEQRRGRLTWLPAANVGAVAPKTAQVCILPHGLTVAADGRRAWVACYGEDVVAAVDLSVAPPAVVRTPLGPAARSDGAPSYGPYSLVADPSGQRAAVGCTESRDLRFFDLQTGEVAKQRWAEPGAGAVYFAAWSADGAKLWVPTQGPDAIHRVDAATAKTEKTRTFVAGECQKPHEVQRSQSGLLLVVCEGDHQGPGQVLALDPQSLQTLWSVPTGAYPDRVALAGPP